MRRSEKVWWWLVWHLPRFLVYLCVVRVWAAGTTGRYGDTEAPALTVSDALRRWEGSDE